MASDVVAFGLAGMTSVVLAISWLNPLAHKTPSQLVTGSNHQRVSRVSA